MNNQQLIAYPQDTTQPITYPTGEVVLDLFKDEPIPLTLNVDDFTNVAEADASYSKSFEIPGTKNNNLFFNNIYDITSDSNFNPHKKTKIIVKEGTINTFEGYMQLNDILHKNGAITYDITLYSEAVNLKDILSDKTLQDIDLSELRHTYKESDIKDAMDVTIGTKLLVPLGADSFAGTSGDTHTGVIRYPLVRWSASSYASSPGNWRINNAWDAFRPWLNCLYIIKNIFRDAGYTFTSSFLNSTKFSKLYNDTNTEIGLAEPEILCTNPNTNKVYDTNWQRVEYGTTTANSNFNASNYYDTTLWTYENYTGVYTNENRPESTIPLIITGGGSLVIQLKYTNLTTGQVWTNNGLNYVNGDILFENLLYSTNVGGLPGEKIIQEVRTTTPGGTFKFGASAKTLWHNATEIVDFENILVNSDKGGLSQWEYLKVFIDMFKLVIMQDESNATNLLIEPYKDWVDAGNLVNLTNKVDDTEIKYTPIDGLAKKLIFKLKEDENDWITINHNKPNDWKYSYNFTPDIEIFDKEMELIEVSPFSATYCKPVDISVQILAPAIINNDTSVDNFVNNFRVLYDNGSFNVINSAYVASPWYSGISVYNQFSSSNEYPITSLTESVNYGVVNYIGWGGGAVLNSLFNVYWFKYIDELYHKDTRIVKIEAYLNADDISKIKFNDIILIKNKKFRIHKIEYRAGAMSKLELITIKDL